MTWLDHDFALSRRSYYADLALAPIASVAVLWLVLGPSALGAVAGFFGWTLTEYVIHRFLLHSPVSPFAAPHIAHHHDPGSFAGHASGFFFFPLILMLGAFYASFGVALAVAVTLGYLAGYFLYILMHDAIHHSAVMPDSWLASSMRHHEAHHRGSAANFGVSTAFWDRVFCTLDEGIEY